MNTVSFDLHGKTHIYRAPSSWNEVGYFTLKAWTLALQADMPESEKLRLAVPIFYNIPAKVYKEIPEHYNIQFAPAIQFVFKENMLDKWILPGLKPGYTLYHGPADKLSNLTAYEFFAYAEPQYWKFKATGDINALNNLIAILYRPSRTGEVNNDRRAPLIDSGIDKRAKIFSKMKLVTRLCILFNYEGCRNFITQLHPKAFSGKGGQSKKRGDVTLSLAGGPLGDLQTTRQSNLFDFLLHLENMIEREEQLQANLNK